MVSSLAAGRAGRCDSQGGALKPPAQRSRRTWSRCRTRSQQGATSTTYLLPAASRYAPAPPEPSSPPLRLAAPRQRWASGVLSRRTGHGREFRGFTFLCSLIRTTQHLNGVHNHSFHYRPAQTPAETKHLHSGATVQSAACGLKSPLTIAPLAVDDAGDQSRVPGRLRRERQVRTH